MNKAERLVSIKYIKSITVDFSEPKHQAKIISPINNINI